MHYQAPSAYNNNKQQLSLSAIIEKLLNSDFLQVGSYFFFFFHQKLSAGQLNRAQQRLGQSIPPGLGHTKV